MAVGDDASAAGYPLVPETGSEEARVRWGAQEINRTRDFVAQVRNLIPAVWPINKGGTGGRTRTEAQESLGFRWGEGPPPTDASHGEFYFRIVR